MDILLSQSVQVNRKILFIYLKLKRISMNLWADTIQYCFLFFSSLFSVNQIHGADSKLHFSLSNCIAMIDADHEIHS